MGTESTRDDAFGTARRDKIAEALVAEFINQPTEMQLERLTEIAQDGFDGFRSMKEQEVFRHGMMLGEYFPRYLD